MALLALVQSACASAHAAPSLSLISPPGSAYLLEATVGDKQLEVVLEFLPSERLALAGSVNCSTAQPTGKSVTGRTGIHQQYVVPAHAVRHDENKLWLECNDTRLKLTRSTGLMLEGTVSLFQKEIQKRAEGPCVEWHKDPTTGRNLYCVRKQVIDVVTWSAWSSPVRVDITPRDAA